uniref:Uncharacterized protein n=1 Tax=Vitis vinifera TaxID=29760 RepID=F6I2S8_VITVI
MMYISYSNICANLVKNCHSNPKPSLARRSISPFPNGIMAFPRSPV